MNKYFFSTAFLGTVLLTFSSCMEQNQRADSLPQQEAAASPVQRGEYLVNALGCDDCHTPKTMTPQGPVPDPGKRFMGHPAGEAFTFEDKKDMIAQQHIAVFSPGMTAAAGPWGVSYAANITPDDTGIGAWTEEQFIKAMREGKSKGLDGTRPILPPMPWPSYRNLNDEDIQAVFAYLKSIKPIANVVPQPVTF